MDHPRIVVVGASAGGVQALSALVKELPGDLPAAVFVVLHIPPHATSHLPAILTRSGQLPAAHAVDGEPIVPGRIYVAPPNRHLLVREHHVALSTGPRENHARPSVDALFRTAARAHGSATIGIILSGALHDGAAGLLAIKSRGGVAMVQDPRDAIIDGMPRAALKLAEADFVGTVDQIGGELVARLFRVPATTERHPMADEEERLAGVIAHDFQTQARNQRAEATTIYTCPDCGGVLWQDGAGALMHFRCHVGHAYAPEALFTLKSEEVETALWTSVRLLREQATLTRQIAARYRERGQATTADRTEEQAVAVDRQATVLTALLAGLPDIIIEQAGALTE